MLGVLAEFQQQQGQRGELGTELAVEVGKARHHEGDEEDEEADHHDDQERRIDERGAQLLAEGERDALELQVAGEHLFEVAGALAGQQRGGVHQRDAALGLKRGGDGFAGLDAGGDVLHLGAESGVLLALGQQLQRAGDGQAGADEGEELLVEDQEGFEINLLLAGAAQRGARLDGVDQVAGLREARA